MLDAFAQFAARVLSRVRVNQIRESLVDGTPFLLKRRRRGASLVIAAGNVFLTLARSDSRMFIRARPWTNWEIHCFRLLYPHLPSARASARRCVALPKLPGASLRQILRHRQPALPAIIAATREIRRAHQRHCPQLAAAWSHGDLHLDNILYDPATATAFLTDFDTRHRPGVPALHRHADDLLVMLLELLALAGVDWPPLAAAVLQSYPDAAVLEHLAQRLSVPRGFARIFFHTRTSGVPTREIASRLGELRMMIHRFTTTPHRET